MKPNQVLARLILGTGQVAHALGVSRTTIHRMVAEGRLAYAFRTDKGVLRFTVQNLMDYLEQLQESGEEDA